MFGLLGVIVGGILSGVVAAGLQRVHDARRAMVTARLVQDDLIYIGAALRSEIDAGVWRRLTANAPPLPFAAWSEGRDSLAAHMSFGEWTVISIAARQAIHAVEAPGSNPDPSGTAIASSAKQTIETLLPDITNGVNLLQPLAHGHRVPSLWRAMFVGWARTN